MTPPHANLRLRLRADTADAHRRLDALAAPLDLTERDDLARFLSAHHRAAIALAGRVAREADMLRARAALAADDLAMLGVTPADADGMPGEPIHPTGLLYVIAGSHLGARQLAATVRRSPEARVRGATTMLDDPALGARWKTLVGELKAAPAQGSEADTVVAAALATFAAYERAFRLGFE